MTEPKDIIEPTDPRQRKCDVCKRTDVTTTFDGYTRRCPICQRRNLAHGCPDCGNHFARLASYNDHAICTGCGADLTARFKPKGATP